MVFHTDVELLLSKNFLLWCVYLKFGHLSSFVLFPSSAYLTRDNPCCMASNINVDELLLDRLFLDHTHSHFNLNLSRFHIAMIFISNVFLAFFS